MHRFYIEPHHAKADTLLLHDEELHHALHVLRAKAGDRAVVLDGAGSEILCEIQSADRHAITLKARHRQLVPSLPCHITLLQAVTRSKSMDLIVQKAAELGAHRLVPILADRTVPHLDGEHAGSRLEKWRRIAIEAIKQSGSAWLPTIDEPTPIAHALSRLPHHQLNLVASLQPDAAHPRSHIDNFISESGALPTSIAVWVGPEGDFTPAEVQAIRAAGSLPITLGQLVLRSETAAIYCLSILNYELQAPRPNPQRPRITDS